MGREITHLLDGVSKIIRLFRAQILRVRELALILIIAGGNIVTGIMQVQEEHARLHLGVLETMKQVFRMNGILDAIYSTEIRASVKKLLVVNIWIVNVMKFTLETCRSMVLIFQMME